MYRAQNELVVVPALFSLGSTRSSQRLHVLYAQRSFYTQSSFADAVPMAQCHFAIYLSCIACWFPVLMTARPFQHLRARARAAAERARADPACMHAIYQPTYMYYLKWLVRAISLSRENNYHFIYYFKERIKEQKFRGKPGGRGKKRSMKKKKKN